MDNLLEIVNESWKWSGQIFVKCLGQNDFGNLMLENQSGEYWRICPEELSIEKIADSREELNRISKTKEFYEDWYMISLVEAAKGKYGVLPKDRKFCLKIPGVLGGKYEISNVGTISLKVLIEFSGHVASEIKDLPDGTKIEFMFTE